MKGFKRVSLRVPEKTAEFMLGVEPERWLRVSVIASRDPLVRELANAAGLANRLWNTGPRLCAGGLSAFGNLAVTLGKAREELVGIQTLLEILLDESRSKRSVPEL